MKGKRMPQEKSFRSEAAVVATGLATGEKRCAWTGTDPLFVAYHDEEWSAPLHDYDALIPRKGA